MCKHRDQITVEPKRKPQNTGVAVKLLPLVTSHVIKHRPQRFVVFSTRHPPSKCFLCQVPS